MTSELIDLGLQELFAHPQSCRRALYQYSTLDGIGDECDAAHDVGYQLSSAQGIALHLLVIEVDLEVDEVRLVLIQIGLELGIAVATCEGVGVLAIGQEHDLDAEAFLQQKVNTAQGSLDPRSITVVEHSDGRGEATDKAYLIDRESCTRRGDDVLNPRLIHG